MSAPGDQQPHPGDGPERAGKRALEHAQHESAFEEMLATFLTLGPSQGNAPALAVLAALANAVVLVLEACALAAALGQSLRAGDGAYVYFEGHRSRRRCCKLNPIALVMRKLAGGISFTPDEARRSFVDWLQAHGPAAFKAPAGDSAAQLAAVESGARCFWSKHLPRLLAKDAEGELHLEPLRPQALARRVTGQPLLKGAPIAPSVFAGAASMLSHAGSIDSSHVMQQVVAIMTAGDGTKLGALRTRQLQLLEPLLDEIEGDTPALMLVLIAAGLCERGTVQKEEPSHSLTARYTRELAQMFNAAPALTVSLTKLAPHERRAAYDELLQHAGDRSDARAALTNADMHLCDAVGCEPVGPLPGEPDDAPRRGPRYLAAHERALVVKACMDVAPTPELQAVVHALCVIFVAKPTRPGDMRDARFEDLEIYDNRVVLNLRRRAGLKGQKTATAEGPMEFTDPATMLALTALRRLREGQAAVGDSPLWGRNLEESRRLYTRACLIVDSACKHVSGDIFESIYSLRHGVISDEELDALTIDDPRLAQIAQRRVSARANHRQVATTVEHYFHLGPEVAHRRARRAVGSLLTPSITAKWSGLSVDALHQRLSRSGLDRTEVLWSAIADAARLSELKSIEVEFPCAPSLAALAKARLTIDDVACSNVCTALRFEDRRRIRDFDELGVTAATPWTRALIEARTRYADQYEDALHPAAMRQPKLRPVARRLRRHCDSASTRKVTQLWRACARRGVLDVSDPIHLHAWLTFLMDCGVPPSRLVLRVEPNMTAKVAVLNAVFSKVTGLVPTIDEVPAGKGRHPAYLLISSQDPVPGQTLPPAATSMAGFNALMVAACIREDLLGDTESGGRDGAA